MNKANDLLNVIIHNKQGILYDQQIEAVTSKNDKGIFDILPRHENFISVIKENIILHRKINESQEMKIENGIMRVYKNNVNIYIGI